MVNNNTSSKKKSTKTKNVQNPEQIGNSSQIELQIIQTTNETKNDIKNETKNDIKDETKNDIKNETKNETIDVKTNDKIDEKTTIKRKRQTVSKDKTKKNQRKTKTSNSNVESAENRTKKKAVSQKKKQKTEKKIDVENEENANTKQKNRFFKLIDENDDSTGRFSGNKPKQAANKALTAIIKKMNATNSDVDSIGMSITFKIKECTRGSKHKEYTYTGFRQKLEEPMRVTIGSGDEKKIIEYKFSNKVKKLPKSSV